MRATKAGITDDGKTIEFARIRGMSPIDMVLYARKINSLVRPLFEKVVPIDAPIFSHVYTRSVAKAMLESARSSEESGSLVTVEGKVIGIKMFSLPKAGDTPLLISRPGDGSNRVQYWLDPEHTADKKLNQTIASSLINPNSERWQWDYVHPAYEPHKAETYSELGLVALTDTTTWIYDINGGGTKGKELWAKPPAEDNPILAEHMTAINEEVLRLKAAQ